MQTEKEKREALREGFVAGRMASWNQGPEMAKAEAKRAFPAPKVTKPRREQSKNGFEYWITDGSLFGGIAGQQGAIEEGQSPMIGLDTLKSLLNNPTEEIDGDD